MGPIFHKLKKEYKDKPILFFYLDYTNNKTRAEAEKKGREAGIENLTRYSDRTGVIVLVKRNDLSSIETLTVDYTIEDIKESIDDAMAE